MARGELIMKRIIFAVILICSLTFPMTADAAEEIEYLLHGPKEEIEQIQADYPEHTASFNVMPMLEVKLSQAEVQKLQKQYTNIDIYSVQQYEVGATEEIVPPQFTTIQTTPEQTTPYTGKGVKIGVIDSGIDVNHSELDVKGGMCALDHLCPQGTPYQDDLGHGTHVAGIIAAKKNGAGIVGVAPNSELYSIKVINHLNSGTTTQIVRGIEWAIENEMDIINMSITTKRNDPALELALNQAYQAGILLVGAAGNDGFGDIADTVTYPAKYESVIAVSAIDTDGAKLYESSMGPEVELTAPGGKINSTYPRILDTTDGKRDGYTTLSGTSMAAPHVTGIAALLKERYPQMSNYEIRAVLANSAKDIGKPGKDDQFGYGLVQYADADFETMPLVVHVENNGKVTIELTNVEDVKNYALTFANEKLQEVAPGKWETYRLNGQYDATMRYTENGKETVYPFTVRVAAPAYLDMGADRWYVNHIAYLAHHAYIQGYLDNTFRADQKITRAEAVALLGRARQLDGQKRKTTFPDVGANHFAAGYIQSAFDKGIVSGFSNGTFRPDTYVTRGEMAILLQQAFNFSVDSSKPLAFQDMSEKLASYQSVQALTQQGILQGYPDGTFRPNEPMTRATFSVFLAGADRPDLFGKNQE